MASAATAMSTSMAGPLLRATALLRVSSPITVGTLLSRLALAQDYLLGSRLLARPALAVMMSVARSLRVRSVVMM